jgi:serine/threonine protein kinase
MSKLGITLDFLESDDDDKNSPLISSPMGNYYAEEVRMTSEPIKRKPFDNIAYTNDIIMILNSGKKLYNIGEGKRSFGQVIELADGTRFILRKTLVKDFKVRQDLINEQLIYKILESDPSYVKYISNLLYADVPLVLHKSDAYNYAYFVFQYEDGMTLDRFIETSLENNQEYSFNDIMILITNISNALRFISSHGIVHRDIKPDNIYLTNAKQTLLFDFDTSCRVGIDCAASEFVGTRKYMTDGAKVILRSNETFSSAEYTYNPYYDLYSVIVILEEDLSKIVKKQDMPRLIEQVRALKGELKSYGGSRRMRNRTRKNRGGAECRIGIMNPTFGGKRKPAKPVTVAENLLNIVGGTRSECPCSSNTAAKPNMALPPGVTLGPITANLMKGGSDCMSCGSAPPKTPQFGLLSGGSCGCQAAAKLPTPLQGGYRATRRNLKYLKRWKQGKSIGFTMRSSLKAKGLIPRANGTKRVSKKYRK